MSYVNNYQCCGHLAADPVLKDYNGSPFAKFAIALNKPGAKRTSYIDCIAWADTALRVAEYCFRGTEVFLSGELEATSYKHADGQYRKSVTLRIEKFSVVSKSRPRELGAVKKPDFPDLTE